MHLLFLNGENLHDCAEMEDTNVHFSDLIKVKPTDCFIHSSLHVSPSIRIIKQAKHENETIRRTVLNPIVRLRSMRIFMDMC